MQQKASLVFEQELLKATALTGKLGFGSPRVLPQRPLLLTKRNQTILAKVAHTVVGQLGLGGKGSLAAHCIQVHSALAPALSTALSTDVHLCVGWISYDERPVWQFDENKLEKWLARAEPFIGGGAEVHAWLALNSMEVIDVTLLATMCAKWGIPDRGQIVADHVDALPPALSYHPVVLGQAALEAIEESRMDRLLMEFPANVAPASVAPGPQEVAKENTAAGAGWLGRLLGRLEGCLEASTSVAPSPVSTVANPSSSTSTRSGTSATS